MRVLTTVAICSLFTMACAETGSSPIHSADAGGSGIGADAGNTSSAGSAGDLGLAGSVSGAGAPGSAGGSSGSGGAGKAALTITPSKFTVSSKGSTGFACSVKCQFSIQEGAAGGTITADGVYTAPDGTGTYHIVGTAMIDGSLSTATATVIVAMKATGTPGVWERVTDAGMDPALFTGPGGFGIGSIVADPAHPRRRLRRRLRLTVEVD